MIIIRQKEFGKKKPERLTEKDKDFIRALAEESDSAKANNKVSYRTLQGLGALAGAVGGGALGKAVTKSKTGALVGAGIAGIGTGIALNKPIKRAIERANFDEDIKYSKKKGHFISRDRIDRDYLIDKREKELERQRQLEEQRRKEARQERLEHERNQAIRDAGAFAGGQKKYDEYE